MVDVGANVGDSVAIVRRAGNFPIVCIEGDDRYFHLLARNVAGLDEVHIVKEFVGDNSNEQRVQFDSLGGTGRLRSVSSSKDSIRTSTLAHVLARCPKGPPVQLLKIDTDGFDTLIIKGALTYLSERKCTVFFEYDPHFLAEHDKNSEQVFSLLDGAGYDTALVYDNYGDYVLSAALSNGQLWAELSAYAAGRNGEKYFDIAVFHCEDKDVAENARMTEMTLSKIRGRVK